MDLVSLRWIFAVFTARRWTSTRLDQCIKIYEDQIQNSTLPSRELVYKSYVLDAQILQDYVSQDLLASSAKCNKERKSKHKFHQEKSCSKKSVNDKNTQQCNYLVKQLQLIRETILKSGISRYFFNDSSKMSADIQKQIYNMNDFDLLNQPAEYDLLKDNCHVTLLEAGQGTSIINN